jgi:hypothetical protein
MATDCGSRHVEGRATSAYPAASSRAHRTTPPHHAGDDAIIGVTGAEPLAGGHYEWQTPRAGPVATVGGATAAPLPVALLGCESIVGAPRAESAVWAGC